MQEILNFEDLQNGSKQKSVAFMVHDLTIWWRHNLQTSKNLKNAQTLRILIISKNALSGIIANDVKFLSIN